MKLLRCAPALVLVAYVVTATPVHAGRESPNALVFRQLDGEDPAVTSSDTATVEDATPLGDLPPPPPPDADTTPEVVPIEGHPIDGLWDDSSSRDWWPVEDPSAFSWSHSGSGDVEDVGEQPTPAPTTPQPTPAFTTPAPAPTPAASSPTPFPTVPTDTPTPTKATTAPPPPPKPTPPPPKPTPPPPKPTPPPPVYPTEPPSKPTPPPTVGTSVTPGKDSSTASNKSSKTSSGNNSSLSGGAIAGIVIGVAAAIGAVVAAVIMVKKSKAKQREENMFADLGDHGASDTNYAAM